MRSHKGKIMKNKIATIALIFTLPLTVHAFSGGDMGDSPEIRAQKIERMTKSLNLSPEQEAKLTNLFEAQGTKYKAIHEETRKQMETFLTKEQLAKMDAMREKRHQKWKKEHGDLTGAETPAAVK